MLRKIYDAIRRGHPLEESAAWTLITDESKKTGKSVGVILQSLFHWTGNRGLTNFVIPTARMLKNFQWAVKTSEADRVIEVFAGRGLIARCFSHHVKSYEASDSYNYGTTNPYYPVKKQDFRVHLRKADTHTLVVCILAGEADKNLPILLQLQNRFKFKLLLMAYQDVPALCKKYKVQYQKLSNQALVVGDFYRGATDGVFWSKRKGRFAKLYYITK